jgi:hypothetical protein
MQIDSYADKKAPNNQRYLGWQLVIAFFAGVVFAYVVRTLFFWAIRDPFPALHKAARNGDLEKVQELLKYGYPV